MLQYIQVRIISAISVLLGVSFLVFGLLYVLPGDALDAKLAEYGASAEQMERLKEQLGLHEPLHVQYWNFVKGAVRGDLGESIFSRQPVTHMVLQQVPATLQLALASTVISVVFGTVIGVVSAIKHNTWVDSLSMVIALVGVSMPSFWLGLLAILCFSLWLGWFPVAGSSSLHHLVLPAMVLGVGGTAIVARMARSSMLEVLGQDYIRTARSKGLRERQTIIKHALRNALIPLITVISFKIGFALSGAVVIEIVFGRQGLGQLAVHAILAHDIPVVAGTVLLVSVTLVITNLIVDILYSVIDPRIRLSL